MERGQRLRSIRKAPGKSQEDVAAALDVRREAALLRIVDLVPGSGG